MIVLTLVKLSMAAFASCMTGPAPFPVRIAPTYILTIRDVTTSRSIPIEVMSWVRLCGPNETRRLNDPPELGTVWCETRRLTEACDALGFDVDSDGDIDLRDWASISNRVSMCDAGQCFWMPTTRP